MFQFLNKLFKRETIDYRNLVLKGAIIIDVRTAGEFSSGHIKGSKNIPLDLVKNRIGEIKKWGKPIITVCRSGNRSAMARSILKTAGLEVYNGGAWSALKHKIL